MNRSDLNCIQQAFNNTLRERDKAYESNKFLNELHDNLKKQVTQLCNRNAELQKENESMKRDETILFRNIKTLENENVELKTKLREKEQTIETLIDEIDNITREIAITRSAAHSFKGDIEILKGKLEISNSEKNELRLENQAIRKIVNDLHKTVIEKENRFRDCLYNIRKKYVNLKRDFDGTCEELAARDRELAKRESELAMCRENALALRARLKSNLDTRGDMKKEASMCDRSSKEFSIKENDPNDRYRKPLKRCCDRSASLIIQVNSTKSKKCPSEYSRNKSKKLRKCASNYENMRQKSCDLLQLAHTSNEKKACHSNKKRKHIKLRKCRSKNLTSKSCEQLVQTPKSNRSCHSKLGKKHIIKPRKCRSNYDKLPSQSCNLLDLALRSPQKRSSQSECSRKYTKKGRKCGSNRENSNRENLTLKSHDSETSDCGRKLRIIFDTSQCNSTLDSCQSKKQATTTSVCLRPKRSKTVKCSKRRKKIKLRRNCCTLQ